MPVPGPINCQFRRSAGRPSASRGYRWRGTDTRRPSRSSTMSASLGDLDVLGRRGVSCQSRRKPCHALSKSAWCSCAQAVMRATSLLSVVIHGCIPAAPPPGQNLGGLPVPRDVHVRRVRSDRRKRRRTDTDRFGKRRGLTRAILPTFRWSCHAHRDQATSRFSRGGWQGPQAASGLRIEVRRLRWRNRELCEGSHECHGRHASVSHIMVLNTDKQWKTLSFKQQGKDRLPLFVGEECSSRSTHLDSSLRGVIRMTIAAQLRICATMVFHERSP